MAVREEDGFLDEIQSNPDDDACRLIYADWLEEQGDARAEFIRVQCRLAQYTAKGEAASDVQDRERRLVEERRQSCLSELGPLGVKDVRFARGLVEKVHCVGTSVLDHPRLLFRHAPALRGMILRNPPRHGAGALQRILTSTRLRTLKTLDFSRNQLRSIGTEGLAAPPHPVQLSALNLEQNQLSGRGIEELLGHPYLSGVGTLNLAGNALAVRDLRLLSRSAQLKAVKSLCLDENLLEDEGLQLLATAPHLAGLSSLSLQKCEIAIGGVRAFANSSLLSSLTWLNLAGNPLGDAGAAIVASTSNMSQLTELNLSQCDIGPEGARALAASLYLRKLRVLDLRGNRLREGAAEIQNSKNFPQLTELKL